jgi:hypothetical protein
MTKYDDVTIAIDRMIAKPCGLGEALNLLEQIKNSVHACIKVIEDEMRKAEQDWSDDD